MNKETMQRLAEVLGLEVVYHMDDDKGEHPAVMCLIPNKPVYFQ